MNNPIKIFNEIFDAYFKYINSGLPFCREEYNQERNALIKETGTICQPPIIEIVPKYHEKATLKEFCINEGVSEDLNDFVSTGLFVNNNKQERRLYDHQYASLKEAHLNRRHIVVTTGTGSGKTECFLLPVIADLIVESSKWGKSRKRAMRTMILYPLNALAEDQMIRLRKALNSRTKEKSGALDWLDEHRHGHRFYFGRYTGATPVSGTREKNAGKLREERNRHIDEWNAAKAAAIENNNTELLYHVPCMENDSAEMWDRISMQDNAPDILITNYSMLNVMLMRDNEADIFADTKAWLKEDPSHIFHLVIDELHTYRGTAGTEVAYLLRILLDRLGLNPNSPQIQFLASSASMEENQQSKDFLSEFFGVNKNDFDSRFVILSNPLQTSVDKPSIELPIDILSQYGEIADDNDTSDTKFLQSIGCSSFLAVTKKYDLLSWLKYALSSGKSLIAKDIEKIGKVLDIKPDLRSSVVAGLVKIICKSMENGTYISPLRTHMFFRNVSGIWGCSDPQCPHVKEDYRFEGRSIGTMYKRPRNVCSCGMKVLEVLVCENCGEVFLGGYKYTVNDHTYIGSEKPVNGDYSGYCILWNGDAGKEDGWKKVSYNPATGEYITDMDGQYSLFEQTSDSETKFPHKCPQCEVEYYVKDKNSLTPIRYHGTGLQKVNQVLADSLIRSMKNANEKNTKVVLFSDSRQSAAKLSAGIELDHYRDVLRWAILHALNGKNEVSLFLKKMYEKKEWETSEGQRLSLLARDYPYGEIAQIIMAAHMGFATEEQLKKLSDFFKLCNGQSLGNIEDDVFKTLLSLGMNPAGPKPTCFKNIMAGVWYDLFDFKEQKLKTDLSQNQIEFSDRIRRNNKIEQLTSIFSNRNRSFEELKLGYLAPSKDIPDMTLKELVCSTIRILGEKKRIKELPSKYSRTDSFPMAVRKLVMNVYQIRGRDDTKEKLVLLRDTLRSLHIIDSQITELTGEGLSFVKAEVGSKYWICPRCKTVHMQHANGICINCFHALKDEYVLTKEDITNPNDYYLTLLNSTDNVYRLHCEEMTGQTSKSDSQKRQRLFQDIFLKTENPTVEGIDLLSVTTTMEAGVDIGSLTAVMMGNVPPQRFNYQQRVGRAGRRGNPLSIALTVARSTSHDLTNFQEYERMVSDTPKDPYLEIRTKEIAERIIYKEILYASMKGEYSGNDSVHGNFGTVDQWDKHKIGVCNWLEANNNEVKRIISVVTTETDITESQKKEIEDFIYNQLIDKISAIASSEEYSQNYLSERLANAGLLPMFGFPTRTRNLYLSKPQKLPSEDVISRDIDMALNSFAPGHEIVKDKKVYKAVGVVDYEYNKSHIISPKSNSLNVSSQPLNRCLVCGYTSISPESTPNTCPVCGNEMERIKICSPLGFCVDYNMKVEDFNGSYDWYSPNSEIKLDCENSLQDCPQVNNMSIRNNIIPSQGHVHLVNDNNGDLYKLGKNSDGMYVSRDVYPEEKRNSLNLSFETKYAFVSSKNTGVLTLSIAMIPDSICLSPLNNENSNSHAVRAAFLSWGYLVRKSISYFLDIDSSELNVGFYISPQTKKAEIFFVEQLENGAGYCNYLSGRRYKDIPFKAIIMPLIENGVIYKHLTSCNHQEGCISSCYDCIRDYSNQSVHHLLDWRLGLDLARLSFDSKTIIDFTVSYWNNYVFNTIKNVLLNHKYSVEEFNDTLIGVNPYGEKYCLIHPLWSQKKINKLIGGLPGQYRPISVFDISKLNN